QDWFAPIRRPAAESTVRVCVLAPSAVWCELHRKVARSLRAPGSYGACALGDRERGGSLPPVMRSGWVLGLVTCPVAETRGPLAANSAVLPTNEAMRAGASVSRRLCCRGWVGPGSRWDRRRRRIHTWRRPTVEAGRTPPRARPSAPRTPTPA